MSNIWHTQNWHLRTARSVHALGDVQCFNAQPELGKLGTVGASGESNSAMTSEEQALTQEEKSMPLHFIPTASVSKAARIEL